MMNFLLLRQFRKSMEAHKRPDGSFSRGWGWGYWLVFALLVVGFLCLIIALTAWSNLTTE